MTVIAFDGKTVAADKQQTSGSFPTLTTKLFRCGDKILAINGDQDAGVAMVSWYMSDQDPNNFPQKATKPDDNCAWLTVFEPGRHAVEYQRHPVPIIIESVPYATGCGRAAAMGAMLAGASAVEAVRITAMVDVHCGGGVDSMELEPHERGVQAI